MTDTEEVKTDYERVEVEPTKDEELVEGQEEPTQSSPSDDEPAGEEQEAATEDGEAEEADQAQEEEPAQAPAQSDGAKPVVGESPREAALRKELERLHRVNRQLKVSQIVSQGRPTPSRAPVDPRANEVLSQYKPEEVQELEKVIGAMAGKLGLVRRDEVQQQTYQAQAESVLQQFLDEHPEYKAENDPDNLRWSQFREAYQMYKPPADPRQYARIFKTIHQSIFGIQSAEGLKKTAAQREKIKVASHGQSARQSGGAPVAKPKDTVQLDPGLKKYLKGDFGDIFE